MGPSSEGGGGYLAIRGCGGTFTLGAWRGLVLSRPPAASRRVGEVQVREGKSNKGREVPLNASARTGPSRAYLQLRPKAQPDEPLFLSDRKRAFSSRAIQTLLRRLARRAKIARVRVTPQLLRHTFALNYLRQNPGKLVQLANLLGHESLGCHGDLRAALGRRVGGGWTSGLKCIMGDSTPRFAAILLPASATIRWNCPRSYRGRAGAGLGALHRGPEGGGAVPGRGQPTAVRRPALRRTAARAVSR